MQSSNSCNPLVINWHLLEPCQFKCKYCYAQWSKPNLPEIYRDRNKSEALIREIASLTEDGPVRLSFAGGEPFLDKKLPEKIAYAHEQNLAISIISNGDLWTEDFVATYSPKIEMLGVSIDSADPQTNLKIGRATLSKRLPRYDTIIQLLHLARQVNPAIEIKINTVVNQFNYGEDMSPIINAVKPDKWKVLRVLPATPKSKTQTITDAQFNRFRKNHAHIPCAQFEDNDDMRNSYLMIDPYGRFFFNVSNGYGYSEPILKVGIKKALDQVVFDDEKFARRYRGS